MVLTNKFTTLSFMEIRRIITLFIAMQVTFICFSQTRIQSRDVKRIAGKAYLLSDGIQYEIRENVILAKLKEGKNQVKNDIRVVESHPFGMLEIGVPKSIAIEEYVKELDKTGDFECIEFDTYAKSCMSANDTYYSSQWGPGKIHADAAWEITTGSPSVKVAVIELDGFELNHPDLYYGNDTYSNLSVFEGVDYVSSTNHTPTNCHGTMVAGIIGAKTNNVTGIAGIAGGNNSGGCKIIPYRANTTANICSAIYDAVTKGAKVINMSFFCSWSYFIDTAITYAYNSGLTIVCGSGNDSSSIVYPASHESTIAVGAVGSNDIRASFSNYGEGLDLVAPGVDIKSTAMADSGYYKTSEGTSYAAPHVSGVVALMLSVNPNLTPTSIRTILNSTATKIKTNMYTYNTDGWNEYVGHGLINACAAVLTAMDSLITGPSYICSSSTATYTINVPSSFAVHWHWSDSFGPTAPVLPSGTTCTFTNNFSNTFMGTLNADIYFNGTYMASRSKPRIIAYSNFYGTAYSYENGTTQQIYPNTPIWVTKGQSLLLKSANLINKIVSYSNSPTTPSSWKYDSFNGELQVTFPSNGGDYPIIISVQNNPVYPNCDNSYQLIIMPNSVLPHMSLVATTVGNGQIVVSLTTVAHSDDSASVLEQYPDLTAGQNQWTLEVYNATNSTKVFSKAISGDSYAVNTTGWSRGVYVVKAIVSGEASGKEELSDKFVIR